MAIPATGRRAVSEIRNAFRAAAYFLTRCKPSGGYTRPASVAAVFFLSVSANGQESMVARCERFPGRNAGEQIASCMQSLKFDGGTADARAFTGEQLITTDMYQDVRTRMTLLLGSAQYRISSSTQVPEGVTLDFSAGATFVVDIGVSLTVNGGISRASDGTIFSGPGRVVLGRRAAIGVNPRWFGAVGNGSADDSLAIQRALDASADGGTVVFSSGTYMANRLQWPQNLQISGQGRMNTILRCNGPGTLLTLHSAALNVLASGMQNLLLDGSGVCARGISLSNVARFDISDVLIRNFSGEAIHVSGALIFQINRTVIEASLVGIKGTSSAVAAANLVAIRDSTILGNSQYGIHWTKGALLILDGNDIEWNGTAGDLDSGAIRVEGMCTSGEGIGLVVRNTWFELNSGHSAIRIDTPALSPCIHMVDATQVLSGERSYGIYMGAGVRYALNAVVAQNATAADIADTATSSGRILNSLAAKTMLAGQTTLFPDPTSDRDARFRLPGTARFSGSLVADGNGAQLGIQAAPQPGVAAQFGPLNGSAPSGSTVVRFGSVKNMNPADRGAGLEINVSNPAASAASIVELFFSSRNNANSAEGPAGSIRFSRPAGADAGAIELRGSATGVTGATVPGMQIDGAGVADGTRLLLYDVSRDTYKRVTVGAPDSCGAGFRCLQIAN